MSTLPRNFYIGVDIGQRVDHSAVCLVEVTENKAIVRALVKYQLGTPWKMLVDTLVELVNSVKQKGEIMSFVVDATGVGAVPSEMIQDFIPDVRIDSFIFTNKSKRELVGKVKVMHSLGKLKFAMRKGDEIYNRTIQELIREMRQIQAKVIRNEDNNPEVEVFKTGTHDDLFTALALAIKDIDINLDMATACEFVNDNTWVKTPLDVPSEQVPVILF